MVDLSNLQAASFRIAQPIFGRALYRTIVEPAVDGFGDDVVRVTLVLDASEIDRVIEDHALDVLVRLKNEFADIGEERWPSVAYATEDELAAETASEVDEDDVD